MRLIHAALAAISGERPDQGRIAPACVSAEHQPVEAVIFGPSAPDRNKRILQRGSDCIEVNCCAGRRAHDNIVDPVGLGRIVGWLFRRTDRIAGLEIHEETHLLEDWHTGRQRDRTIAGVYLDPYLVVGIPFQPVGARQDGVTGRQICHRRNIAHRLVRPEGFAIGCIESPDEGTCIFLMCAFKVRLDQRRPEALLPCSRDLDDTLLERRKVRQGMALSQPDFEMDPDQGLGIKIRSEARHMPIISGDQFLRDALTHGGVIGFTRHIDDCGDKPVKLVLLHEQARAWPPDQMQRADNDRMEDFRRGLKQLVTRPGFQQIGQRLFGMSAGRCARSFEDGGNSTADQRDRAGRFVIGLGGEKAEEANFTIHPALRIIFLHADIVASDPAVHEAGQRRFGNKDRIRFRQMCANLRRQHEGFGLARQNVQFFIAQHAQIGALHHDRLFGQHLPIGICLEFVFAAAEEHEMFPRKPFQEGNCFVAVHLFEMRDALQPVDLLLHARPHGLKVRYGNRIVRQRQANSGFQARRLIMGQDRQMNLDDGHAAPVLSFDNRMKQGRDLKPLRAALAKHRIHEEWHVRAGSL